MKKIFVSLAALVAAAFTLSAQSMADATETAKIANESLAASDYQTALAGFQEALKMAEACGDEGQELVATCKDIIPKTMIRIAKQSLRDGDVDAALEMLDKTAATAAEYADDETAAEAAGLVPQAYMAKGNNLLKAGDFAGAAEAFAKATELDAENANAWLRLGQASERAGDLAKAKDAYEKAGTLGDEKNANTSLGKLYLKMAAADLKAKKFAAAVQEAVKSNEFAPNPTALQVAGQASQLGGKNADAIKYFEQYLEAAPTAKNAGQIAYTLGALYQQAKNNAKAKEYFTKALNDPKYGPEAKKILATLK